jgi:type IV secretion system protein VirB10
MNDREPPAERVAGERDASLGVRLLSMQSRVSNVLAVGLMSTLGLGTLTWYYAHALLRQSQAKEIAQSASAKRAQGDLPLPSLGRIGGPPLAGLFEPAAPDSPATRPPLAAQTLDEVPAGAAPAGTAGPPAKTPEQLAVERELSGAVFEPRALLGSRDSANAADPASLAAATDRGSDADPLGANGAGALAALLHPTTTAAVHAQRLPAQRLLLPKGSFIDCTLETAIDSTLPGMTTCLMATDAFGVDGKVVLMERGTKLIGETRGQVAQGAARIFVLWTEARTPTGVVVPLDSPGADELGRSGLSGEVNRHFWQRFGAAMLVSVIDGAVQAAAESSRGGSGAVIVNPSGSQDVLTEILKNTIAIPPTVVKRNGDRIQVLVARDLDFRSVYELRSAAGR